MECGRCAGFWGDREVREAGLRRFLTEAPGLYDGEGDWGAPDFIDQTRPELNVGRGGVM